MPRQSDRAQARSGAIRAVVKVLGEGGIVLVFPEAGNERDFTMRALAPRVGAFFRLVLNRGCPILPAGISRRDGRFTVAIGEPIRHLPTRNPEALSRHIGHAIAGLVPSGMRGPYAADSDT